MKFAVLSDIHSNDWALEACLCECQKECVDGYIFLGDYVSDCPDPENTLRRLYQLQQEIPCWFVRGNREEYQIDHACGKSYHWHPSSSTGSLLYTYNHLSMRDFEFIANCPVSQVVDVDGIPSFTICHGSPRQTKKLLHIGSKEARECLEQSKTELVLCGHTHIQGEMFWNNRILLNPGSVGIPENQTAKGEYMILSFEDGKWQWQMKDFSYDIDGYIEKYRKSELACCCGVYHRVICEQIKTGINTLLAVTKRIHVLMEEDVGYVTPGDIPEKYWQKACDEIIKEND